MDWFAPIFIQMEENAVERCLSYYSPMAPIAAKFHSCFHAVKEKMAALLAAASESPLSNETSRSAVSYQAEQILNTYGNSILRFAYSYLHNMTDAEDVLQDTLVQFLKTAPSFASQQHEKAWLLRVAGNLSKNRLTYNRIRMADELNSELVADHREDLSFVWEAVKALPDPLRETVHLFYYEGFSTKEIAAILQKNEATVRTHLRRGRGKLKELLKEGYDFDETV